MFFDKINTISDFPSFSCSSFEYLDIASFNVFVLYLIISIFFLLLSKFLFISIDGSDFVLAPLLDSITEMVFNFFNICNSFSKDDNL